MPDKVECIPIKKRRHLLQLLPSSYCEESLSPESLPIPTQSEEIVGKMNSDSYISQQSHSCNEVMDVKSNEVRKGEDYNAAGDFSGVALLSAAACNDGIHYNSGSVEGGSDIKATSLQQNVCVSTSPFPLKPNVSVNNSMDSAEGDMLPETKAECSSSLKKSPIISRDLSERAEDGELIKRSFSPKFDRMHWDLNISMDTWEQPYDDTVRRNALNNVICNEMHKEKLEIEIPEEQRDSDICLDNSEKCLSLTQMHPSVVPSVLKIEENKGGPVSSLNATCGEEIPASNSGPIEAAIGLLSVEKGIRCHDAQGAFHTDSTSDMCLHASAISIPESTEGEGVSATESNMQFEQPKGPQSDDPASPSTKIRNGSSPEVGHNSEISQENAVQPIGSVNVSGFQAGGDSPFEDGELRGSLFYSWEENEVDCEMECVDYESDGDALYSDAADDHSDSEIVEAGSHGNETKNSPASLHQEEDINKSASVINTDNQSLIGEPEKIDFGGKKESDTGSDITTLQHRAEMSVEGNIGVRNRRCATNHMNGYEFRQVFKEETGLSAYKGKLQSHIESPMHLNATNRKDAVLLHNFGRPHGECDSYSGPKRDYRSERYEGRYRSSHYTNDRNVVRGNWGYSDSSNHYSSIYRGSERRGTWRRNFAAATDKFGGADLHDLRHSTNYSSNVTQTSNIRRRSSVDRDDYVEEVPWGRLPARGGISNNRGRGRGREGSRRYNEQFLRVFTEEGHNTLPNDAHRFSPFSSRRRGGDISLRQKRSRSPHAWHSQRERIQRTRPNRSSPDSRFEARMERTRVPFKKYRHGGEGFMSSPTSSNRLSNPPKWVGNNNQNPMDNHWRHRRSPMGNNIRRTQRFDDDDRSGRPMPDDYFRPGRIKSERFSPVDSSEKEFKMDETCNYKRHEYEMIQETMHSDASFLQD